MTLVRGITYDTGCETAPGRLSRPTFDAEQAGIELRVIATELGCTAVRLVGNDLERLTAAASLAVEAGLEVWLSPALHDQPTARVLDRLERSAALAEDLAVRGANVVLVVGWESTAFVPGMLNGGTTFERLRTLTSLPRLLLSTARHGSFNRRLDEHLQQAVETVRRRFGGRLTYAAGLWEEVDWRRFDIVGIDAYRDAGNAGRFTDTMRAYARHGKPVAALEFGCCTYTGAGARGAWGWSVADPVTRSVKPVVRDEGEQADYLEEVFAQLQAAGVAATFPFTFASYSYPTIADGPDLDVGAYGIVRCFEPSPPEPLTIQGVPWQPKLAFHRLAGLYRQSSGHSGQSP